MNPEEKLLLERTLKLSEENNLILRKIQKTTKRAAIWGFIKVIIVVTPLFIGYFYLQPYFKDVVETYNTAIDLLNIN